MNEINAASGKLIAEAIDKRITSVAKQLFNNSERDKTVYGIITKTNQGYFSVKVNNQIYNNVDDAKGSWGAFCLFKTGD